MSVVRIPTDNHPDYDDRFDHAPNFKFYGGKVKFGTNRVDNANDNYGSASAFVPKYFSCEQKAPTMVSFVYVYMKTYKNIYNRIISIENLFLSWEKFKKGKRTKEDVEIFERDLEPNIFQLHHELASENYQHQAYTSFFVCDPKLRHINKATVRDRIVHHALFRILNPIFEPSFIATSFSCRIGKGNHKGVEVLRDLTRKVSNNYTGSCYALKCDVQKFFDSVGHEVLINIIAKKIRDPQAMNLITNIIRSYSSRQRDLFHSTGLPIGNLTSQLFANIYMNELDQYVKQTLKVKYYLRYTDDFIVLADNPNDFENLLSSMEHFLKEKLFLSLHPEKVQIRKLHHGIDFLGYVVRPRHTAIRNKTRKRMIRRINEKIDLYKKGAIDEDKVYATLNSYTGLLVHANEHRFSEDLKNMVWFRMKE